MNQITVGVKKLHKDALIPTKAYATDAGWDLYCLEEMRILSGATCSISTGIAMSIPVGWYGQIKGRSGLSRMGTTIVGGVIDSGFFGEAMVVMTNTHNSPERILLKPGDKIAQIVFLPVPEVVFKETDDLGVSPRGSNGFGSTGR